MMAMLNKITVHGRFQPPLHLNHWNYLSQAFELAQKVVILITNPDLNESSVAESIHRNKKENNPFTYEERVQIFKAFFDAKGIPETRYEFQPFDIVNEDAWEQVLDSGVPNLVNVYGEWSEKKLKKFQQHGLPVIQLTIPRLGDISGRNIRGILNQPLSFKEKRQRLIEAGYMPEAVEGLFKVLSL